MNYKTLSIIAVYLALGSCGGSTSSDNVTSEGIMAEIEIDAYADNITKLKTVLKVGSNGTFGTDLNLSSSDTLTAIANGETKVFSKKTDLLGAIDYRTSFASNEGDRQFRVSLDRANNTSMPNSTVTLPQAFSVTSPINGAQFDTVSNTSIELRWNPPGYLENVSIHFMFECDGPTITDEVIFAEKETLPDNGLATFDVGALLADRGLPDTGSCDTNIEVRRTVTGTLDPNYGEGGYIRARQLRDVDVVIEF